MRSEMKKGNTFTKAHTAAMKKVGKWVLVKTVDMILIVE